MKYLRHLLPLITILIAAVFIRYALWVNQPYIKLPQDGYEYYQNGISMVLHPIVDTIINPYRTPIYPLIVSASMALSGAFNSPIASPAFGRGADFLMFLQAICGVISVIFLYRILEIVNAPRIVIWISTFLAGTNLMTIPWERTLLTESIAGLILLSLILLFFQILHAYSHYSNFKFLSAKFLSLSLSSLLFALLLFLAPLIRPSLSPIGPVLAAILVFVGAVKKKRTLTFKGLLFLVISVSPVFLWINGNTRIHKIHAFQVQGDINILGRIMKDRISIEGAKSYAFFYDGLTHFRIVDTEMNPYKFTKDIDPLIHTHPSRLTELQGFVRTVMRKEVLPYTMGALKDYPNTFLSLSPEITLPSEKNRPYAKLLSIGQTISRVMLVCVMVLFVVSVMRMFWLFLYTVKKRCSSQVSLYEVSLIAVASVSLLFNLFFGYEDFARLSAPIMPVIISVSVWTLNALMKSIKFNIH